MAERIISTGAPGRKRTEYFSFLFEKLARWLSIVAFFSSFSSPTWTRTSSLSITSASLEASKILAFRFGENATPMPIFLNFVVLKV